MEHYEAKYRQDQIQWLAKRAAALNLQLTPLAGFVDWASGGVGRRFVWGPRRKAPLSAGLRPARDVSGPPGSKQNRGTKLAAFCRPIKKEPHSPIGPTW